MQGKPATQTTNATTNTQPWAPTQPGLNALLGQIVGTPAGGGYGSSPQMGGGMDPGSMNPLMRAAYHGVTGSMPGQGGVPGGPLSGGLLGNTGLTGTEDSALKGLMANAQSGNPYAAGIDASVRGLEPIASGSMVDPGKNPYFKTWQDTVTNDLMNQYQSQYAAAGRDPSGAGSFAQNSSRGILQGIAPTFAQQYNTGVGQQMQAAGMLPAAASSALQARDAPLVQQLSLEQQRRNIPVQNTAAIANLLYPMAALGQQGQSHSTSTMTPATPSPFQTIAGLGIAGAGLLSGNPMMGLGGLGAAGSGWGGMSPMVNPWTQGGVGTAGAWGL